jgi:hypothetical protein
MPQSDVRSRIKRLMDEQAEEAAQPVSYAMFQDDETEELPEPQGQQSDSDSTEPPTLSMPPSEPVEPQQEIEPPEEPEVEPAEMTEIPPPEDWSEPVQEFEPPEERELEPVPEMAAPEQEREFEPEMPDWESMLGYIGQQANDQLFDGIAIRLAESTHRQINRVQDRFEQHMAELDIGNSY